ncbi:uncharacterized protein LOC127123953 [Lathyrus oleraceus]|uniref:uncharacterized protein LOC127123953 n=1 Tax=Pisum sativum TaxID=3888 RepID=UPI0021CFA09D|nr:uncharacterized protein LOC127123953 [Pisum sativum]
MQCPQGLLGRNFEKLIQCDPRLNFLSQQQDFVLESPYFETGTAIHDRIETSDGFGRKSEGHAGIFVLQDVESGSAGQSSSSRSEHNLMGKAVENNFQEITSPSSVMNPHAIIGFKSRGAESLKFLSNLDQIKLPGLHPSMSIEDLVNHIGHCITEQMGPENSSFASDRAKLEEFTQYLFNDSQIQPASDEQNVMSRVNSFYNLLQKYPNSHPKLSSKPKPCKNRNYSCFHQSEFGDEVEIGRWNENERVELAPTLEEVERIVGLKLKDFNPFPKLEEDMGPKKITSALSINVPTVRDNWGEKGGCEGFAAIFLEDLALKFKKSGNWNAFYVVLALLIHGIVLFPNVEKFVWSSSHRSLSLWQSSTVSLR